jgi:hypothetical protein
MIDPNGYICATIHFDCGHRDRVVSVNVYRAIVIYFFR